MSGKMVWTPWRGFVIRVGVWSQFAASIAAFVIDALTILITIVHGFITVSDSTIGMYLVAVFLISNLDSFAWIWFADASSNSDGYTG